MRAITLWPYKILSSLPGCSRSQSESSNSSLVFTGCWERCGSFAGVLRPLMQDPAAPSHLSWSPAEEVADHLLAGAQAEIARRLLSGPAPNGLIGVEVRAVRRQVHQPQVKLRPQIFPHRLATVGRRIVPDDPQRARVLRPVASGRQPRSRCCCCPPAFHLARLQAHCRIVAGLLPIPRAGRVYQSRLALQHPLASQSAGPEWAAKNIRLFRPASSSRMANSATTVISLEQTPAA